MSLLDQRSIAVKDSEEINILSEGLKMTRLDYSLGQLKYVVEKYGVSIHAVIENKLFYNKLARLKRPSKLKLENGKIDRRFIADVSGRTNPIIYIDRFYLGGAYHYPHFVIITLWGDSKVKLYDPWIGREANADAGRVVRAVQGLRNNLKLSPKLIFMD